MINIISRSYVLDKVSGPKKVVDNFILGLKKIDYPYCINQDLNSTSQVWIHDDVKALEYASKNKIKAVVGPNLYILPRHISPKISFENFVYLHPSPWTVSMWKNLGFDRCPIESWPTGINTDQFTERKKSEDHRVMIYFKQRFDWELDYVKNILNAKKINHTTTVYGSYDEKQYIQDLEKTKYIIWIGRQESQGIALQEALSKNIPIIVWDVEKVGHWKPRPKEEKIFNEDENNIENTTSAPYFDNQCGLKVKNKKEIQSSIEKMEKDWETFTPREFVLKNLNPEKQALELINFFEKYFNISKEAASTEKKKNNEKWINASLRFRLYKLMRNTLKKIIALLRK